MAHKKHYRKRAGKLPLAIAAPVAIAGIDIGKMAMDKNYGGAVAKLTGYDPTNGRFDIGNMTGTYVPIVVGVVVHKFVGRYVNRSLPKWLPFNI